MKFKVVIFDMDGTILDTEHIWDGATHKLVLNKGFEFTPELKQEIDKLNKGKTMYDCCKNIKNVLQLADEIEDLVQEKTLLAREMYQHDVKFVRGFTDFHTNTIDLNLASALATNADDEFLGLMKNKFNLSNIFGEHIYNPSHVNYVPKPNPDLFLYTADKLKTNPNECIVIEDSPTGIAAAKAAGMFCIGINTGKNKELLKQSDLIIDEYKDIDLKNIIKK